MGKDSNHTYIHLQSSSHADLSDEFSRPPLPAEEIFIPPSRQPPNPEDEDDVVPDQHAAFGIQRATQARREPAWRDFGLDDVVDGSGIAALNLGGGGGATNGMVGEALGLGNGAGAGGAAAAAAGRDQQVARAGMGRGARGTGAANGIGVVRGEVRARGGVADVGAVRAVHNSDRRPGLTLPR